MVATTRLSPLLLPLSVSVSAVDRRAARKRQIRRPCGPQTRKINYKGKGRDPSQHFEGGESHNGTNPRHSLLTPDSPSSCRCKVGAAAAINARFVPSGK